MIWVAVAIDPAQFSEISKNEKLLTKVLLEETGDQKLDLDKAWHGIHYLLNGTAWTINNIAGKAIIGGEEFGPDIGYGPPHIVSATQVREIAAALEKITPEQLSARYNPEAMEKEEIYPTIIWKRDGAESLKFLLNYFQPLRTFYQRAAQKGLAVIIAIT